MLLDLYQHMSPEFQKRYVQWIEYVYIELCEQLSQERRKLAEKYLTLKNAFLSYRSRNFEGLMQVLVDLPTFPSPRYFPDLIIETLGTGNIFKIIHTHPYLNNAEKRIFLLSLLEQRKDYLAQSEILFCHPYLDLFLEDPNHLAALYRLAYKTNLTINILPFAEEEIWQVLLSNMPQPDEFLVSFIDIIPTHHKFRAFHFLLKKQQTEDALHVMKEKIEALFFDKDMSLEKHRHSFNLLLQICILEFKKENPHAPLHNEKSLKFLRRGLLGTFLHCNTVFSYRHRENIDERLVKYQLELAKEKIKIPLAPEKRKYITNLDLIPLCKAFAKAFSCIGDIHELFQNLRLVHTPPGIESLMRLVDFDKYGTKEWATRELSCIELFHITPILQDLDDIFIYRKKFLDKSLNSIVDDNYKKIYEEIFEDLKLKEVVQNDVLTSHFVDFANAKREFGDCSLFNLAMGNQFIELYGKENFYALKHLRKTGNWSYANFSKFYADLTNAPQAEEQPLLRPIL